MLVYGGLLLVVILALLGIVLLLRETEHTTRKVTVQQPEHSVSVPASAVQADRLSQDAQINEKIEHQSTLALRARDEEESIASPSVTSIQSMSRTDAVPLVTHPTGVGTTATRMPRASRLIKVDDDRIVLTAGQFGALLSELRALRQHSEEIAERLDIVSASIEQLAPTQAEFPAISFNPSSTLDTPAAQRDRQFMS